jgi:predicted DNA-binding transcriptional regulator YafY
MMGDMPDDSPTARSLRTLEMLQDKRMRAEELATRLGVTERAARRYVGILREAGIPVESLRGPHGGYRLGRGTRLPPVSFSETEAVALVMAVLDAPGSDPEDIVGSALGKVIRALPEGVGRQAASLRQHAATVSGRHSARPDPAVTCALVGAVAARRRVTLTYRSEVGNEWDAEVDPWAVVVRHGRWYLLCHSHHAGAIRTYRLDRIRGTTQTDERFTAPEGLDPVAVLEENLGAGWEFATRVVVEAPLSEVAPWVRPPMGRLEALGEGCVLVGSTSNPTMYAGEWLARLPFPFRVEGGPELRAVMTTLAERLAAAVEQPLHRQVPARRGAG